jgi:lipopolysaccharide assembly outer membrane protein LptD (OstA)
MATVGAIYDRKTDIAHAQSPVTITDPETTVTGKAGDVDFKKHIATLSGNVHVDIEPKPDKGSSDDDSSAKSEAKQPSTMTCDAIVYNYKTKFAITNGTVVIKQEHRTVTADKGTYDVKTHIAELTGNMVATSDDGKVLKAEYAKVSVKKGDEWIDIPHPTEMLIPVNPDDNPRNTK